MKLENSLQKYCRSKTNQTIKTESMFKLKPCNVILLLCTTMLLIASDHDTHAKPFNNLGLASKVLTPRANYVPKNPRYLSDDAYKPYSEDNLDVDDTIALQEEFPIKRQKNFVSCVKYLL